MQWSAVIPDHQWVCAPFCLIVILRFQKSQERNEEKRWWSYEAEKESREERWLLFQIDFISYCLIYAPQEQLIYRGPC